MTREHWTESDDPRRIQRGAAGTALIWGLGILVVVGLLSAVIWGIGVITSDAHGRGEAIKKKNDATNRIAAQERFEEMYAGIKSADDRLQQAWNDKQASPDDKTVATNYTGLKNYCVAAVGDYNAEANKYTAQQFRDARLPYEIETGDEPGAEKDTDCEPDHTATPTPTAR